MSNKYIFFLVRIFERTMTEGELCALLLVSLSILTDALLRVYHRSHAPIVMPAFPNPKCIVSWLWIAFIWCILDPYDALRSVGVAAAPLADEQSGSSDACHQDPNETTSKDKREAALRLMKAAIPQDENSMGDSSSAREDWQIVLGRDFDTLEIEAMLQQAYSATHPSNSTSTVKPSNQGECPAVSLENEKEDNRFTADRHIRGILDTHHNKNCLERTFDVQSPHFRVDEARQVFAHCRILVLKRALSQDAIHTLLPKFTNYIEAVDKGEISPEGTTNWGGKYYILREDAARLNYMIPRALALQAEEFLRIPSVMQILGHPSILGDDFIVNHMGSVNAQPGANRQYWHADSEYLVERGSESGVSGNDLPMFSVNMFTPLLNVTLEHGPTEFCLGTSHLRGLDLNQEAFPLADETILQDDDHRTIVDSLHDFEYAQEHGFQPDCPDDFLRIPVLEMGDVVLFDYMVSHRGGPNLTNELRSMLFSMYSRKWFRDTTFDTDFEQDESETELEYLLKLTRFAVVHGTNDDDWEEAV